jgi:hypoxanthine-DNA glycosylase
MISRNQKTDSRIYSFAPIVDRYSRVLILGTIPGNESLRTQRYYAHPRNAFWKILFNILELPLSDDYQIRRDILLQYNIALWDVLKTCERRSSLDNDIRREEPNDIQTFLSLHPNIDRIFFNGKGSARYFEKYFADIRLPNQVLTSTSPAHAIKWEQKLAAWQIIKITTF